MTWNPYNTPGLPDPSGLPLGNTQGGDPNAPGYDPNRLPPGDYQGRLDPNRPGGIQGGGGIGPVQFVGNGTPGNETPGAGSNVVPVQGTSTGYHGTPGAVLETNITNGTSFSNPGEDAYRAAEAAKAAAAAGAGDFAYPGQQ